jgi:hypothetical protein
MKPINQEMNETAAYGSFFEFLEKNKDRLFRFWVYKRMFTPLEQEKRYLDQDVYEDYHAHTGIIKEAIVLPDNDLLLGFYIIAGTTSEEEDPYRHLEYYKLSEIRMEYRPVDMEEYYGGDESE